MKKTKKQKELIPQGNQEITADLDLLRGLLSKRTYSRSKEQDEFVDWLETLFNNDANTITERDNYGNLYVTKGIADLYPCLVAHTDINQEEREVVEIIITGDWIHGFDPIKGEAAGLGADDKCGIGLAIEMFNRFDTIKLFFPKDEEVGLLGTHQCNRSFFTNCTMLLQGDRRSYTTDLITYTNGRETCSKEFVDTISDIMSKYGYSENRGVATDIGGLKAYSEVNCIACNISIGYFNEHSDNEVISISRYNNAINFVYEILKTYGQTKFYHVSAKEKSYNNSSNYYSKSYNTLFDDAYAEDSDYLGKQMSLFGYDEKDSSLYPIQTPTKFIRIPKERITDRQFEDYCNIMYPEYDNVEKRKELMHFVLNYETGDMELEQGFDQSEIDDIITQGGCPICGGNIDVSNSLMIGEVCYDCGSTFNITPDDYLTYHKLTDEKEKN